MVLEVDFIPNAAAWQNPPYSIFAKRIFQAERDLQH